MKKNSLVMIFMILITSTLHAQWPYRAITVKCGGYSPKDIGSSYLFSANITFKLFSSDELGVGLDYFGKHEKDIITLNENNHTGPVMETEVQTVTKTNVHLIPIYGIYIIRFPFSPRNTLFLSGTAGYNFLISKFKDYYHESESVTNEYRGFTLSLGSGFMYRLNHQFALVCEGSYCFSEVSRNKSTSGGAPIKALVDISGFSFRIGLRRGVF